VTELTRQNGAGAFLPQAAKVGFAVFRLVAHAFRIVSAGPVEGAKEAPILVKIE
jgi:hypothetical protein